jgi:hypothetical protein
MALLEELEEAESLERLVSHRLIECVPSLFQEDRASYIEWKTDVAERLDVDPYGVIVVGSSATGVSLNPNRNFKEFDETSDVDVAVVSGRYFEGAWWFLRNIGATALTLEGSAKRAIRDHAPRDVFRGFIATDQILAHLPFGAQWVKALASLESQSPLDGRTLNVRLYRDVESLREYQLSSFTKARERLLARQEE